MMELSEAEELFLLVFYGSTGVHHLNFSTRNLFFARFCGSFTIVQVAFLHRNCWGHAPARLQAHSSSAVAAVPSHPVTLLCGPGSADEFSTF